MIFDASGHDPLNLPVLGERASVSFSGASRLWTSVRVHSSVTGTMLLSRECESSSKLTLKSPTYGPKSTPEVNELPSSAIMIDSDGSRVVPKEIYESLVRKFNKLYENNADIISARDRLEKALIAEKEKLWKGGQSPPL